ncbi:helix-turn-helix domain-containing protein [Dactylosporangium sp. AC04546]|uniref:TetR/AcrR family transcriptional regulator n=1 Tax=Dactylosporangium sp. AC04546 TaxID=2862460 RepID=UPI001EDE2D72|nr:TetR/AcrR family transcriptional regulator [Dactylosporangium sp. AC04546]WVK86743.1 helix-turn-helix domain-containing protein [Dactylosporangium sp. AC04546]
MSESHPRGPVPRTPREEVRRRLLTVAMRVFAERGYAESRLEDIAHAAGFTKGAVYSNFGSKQGLFGAVLAERASTELTTVMAEVRDTEDLATAAGRAAQVVARRIVDDTERGRLGLEFAALAARDEQARTVLTPLRREQRAAAARSLADAAEHTGTRLAISPDLAALILHCLTNGLSMEHLADAEAVNADAVEKAISAVIAALFAPTQNN